MILKEKKKLLLILLIAVFMSSGVLFAKGENKKLRVGVVEFEVAGDLGIRDAGKIIAEWLISSLGKLGVYNLQERALLRKVLKEQKLEISGVIDERTAAMIGKLYGVDAIVTGSVTKWGDLITINARIIDTSTGSIIKTGQVKTHNVNAIPQMMDNLAEQLAIRHVKPVKFSLAVTDGLVMFLKMDKVSGTVVEDSYGSNECYTRNIKVSRGGGYIFNCVDSYVACGNSTDFDKGTPFSVVAWVKITRKPDRMMAVVRKDGMFSLDVDDRGYPEFTIFGVDSVSGDKPLVLNRWYMLEGSYDGNVLTLYVNAVPSGRFERKGKIPVSSEPLVIGDWSEKSGDRDFCGIIDDVRFYNRVLKRIEINDIFRTGRSKIGR